MAGFTAPPSNQVAGGGGGGGGEGAEDGDDTAAAGVLVDGDGSCWFGEEICIEPNEPDNMSWCLTVGGTYTDDWCSDGETGTCDIPAGGDYTAGATSYFYDGIDGELPACRRQLQRLIKGNNNENANTTFFGRCFGMGCTVNGPYEVGLMVKSTAQATETTKTYREILGNAPFESNGLPGFGETCTDASSSIGTTTTEALVERKINIQVVEKLGASPHSKRHTSKKKCGCLW